MQLEERGLEGGRDGPEEYAGHGGGKPHVIFSSSTLVPLMFLNPSLNLLTFKNLIDMVLSASIMRTSKYNKTRCLVILY